MPTGRERWFADVLHAGLETKLLTEQDVLSHVTPAVLAGALPRDVLVRVFDAALTSGTISPKAVLEAATPELMAERAPAAVWRCIAAASERAGIPEAKPKDEAASREFLRRALDAALTTGVLTPSDVVQHVNAEVLGHLPDALATKLLEVSLAAGRMSPQMVIDTLGVDAITKHAPTAVVWASFVKVGEATAAAERNDSARTATRPALEVLDDDMSSILVDLEESGETPIKKDVLAHAAAEKPAKKTISAAKRD